MSLASTGISCKNDVLYQNLINVHKFLGNGHPVHVNNGCFIRKACNEADMDTVYQMTHDAYVAKKYCDPQKNGRLVHYPHLDTIPETVVLLAVVDETVAGSISFTVDGPKGLSLDDDFFTEIEKFRNRGITLAASWRAVTRHDVRRQKSVFMGLVKTSISLIFRELDIDVLFAAVHPENERAYNRLFNFHTIARQTKSIYTLKNAPAILMRLKKEDVPERWFSDDWF